MLAKGSVHIIALPFFIGIIFLYYGFWYLMIPIFAFGFHLIIFFRDPERSVGGGICAVADGVVLSVEQKAGALLISTFMNVHNVHVNRAPIDGQVVKLEKVSGTHKPAFSKAAVKNTRGVITLNTDLGLVKIVQISGTFAWRVVQYVSVGDLLTKGQRIGMIRFGSRVDLILPPNTTRPLVCIGQKLRAGETTVAEVV
jgi:phosphatidylserine decarboxylase